MRPCDKQRRRLAQIKSGLLAALEAAEQAGAKVDTAALAMRLECSASHLRKLRLEMSREGLTGNPQELRLARYEEEAVPPDLEDRIAAVRKAKDRFWAFQRDDLRNLSREELLRVLPE